MENPDTQSIKDFLAKILPGKDIERASEKLVDLVMEDTLNSLPDDKADQLRGQIEAGAAPEEMEQTIKSANLDLNEIVKRATKKLVEEK